VAITDEITGISQLLGAHARAAPQSLRIWCCSQCGHSVALTKREPTLTVRNMNDSIVSPAEGLSVRDIYHILRNIKFWSVEHLEQTILREALNQTPEINYN